MKRFIRYNDFKNDEYSSGNPGNAISSRLDLNDVLFLIINRLIQEHMDQLMEKLHH